MPAAVAALWIAQDNSQKATSDDLALTAGTFAGWDGTAEGRNDTDRNFVLLRSYPDGDVPRRAHTPGRNKLMSKLRDTLDLMGREVFLEVVDANPRLNPGGFAWIAFADYRQESWKLLTDPVDADDLFGLAIDGNAEGTVHGASLRAVPAISRLCKRSVIQGCIDRGSPRVRLQPAAPRQGEPGRAGNAGGCGRFSVSEALCARGKCGFAERGGTSWVSVVSKFRRRLRR